MNKFVSENRTLVYSGVTAVVILLVMLYRKNASEVKTETVAVTSAEVQTSPFITPYFMTPMLANPTTGNGGPSFMSNISINVNPDVAQYLNRSYVPLFGFVGMNA